MTQDFPHDETGELLRLMKEQGDDLSLARNIDFYLIFDTKDQATAFANSVDLGPEFRVSTSHYEKTAMCTVRDACHLAVFS